MCYSCDGGSVATHIVRNLLYFNMGTLVELS
jgi:hypothetical protein